MRYSNEQLDRLKYLVNDRWVTDDDEKSKREFDRVLAQVESPYELHQYAANFNWDGGFAELEKVIKHPLCDKGTALMIYFAGGAVTLYNRQHQNKELIGEQPLLLAFLKEIETKVKRNEFKSDCIKFDPTNTRGRNFLSKPGAELIPPHMKQPTEGEAIELLNLLE
jgi:hypothetical protein